jgi:RNA polymerase sigma factor (sigma-70 family)
MYNDVILFFINLTVTSFLGNLDYLNKLTGFDQMNESDLWSLFLQGDKHAFSEIYLAFHDDLYRYGIRLSRDQDTVNDCIQNLFLKLWKNRNNLKPVREIKPYLFRSLRNHIVDILELEKQIVAINRDVEDLYMIEFNAEDFMISGQTEKETQEKIIYLLNQLPPRQRHAIYLRYFEEMEFETIAQVMKMNVQSVRNSICRGLQLMRDTVVILSFCLLIG